MKNIKSYFRKHSKDLVYILLLLLCSSVYFLMNRPWGHIVFNFKSSMDDMIPTIPATIIIYQLWYPILLLVLIVLLSYDRRAYFIATYTILIGDVVSLITYYYYQNKVVRDPVLTTDIFSRFLNFTRTSDNPYNGLPSMHILACVALIFVMYCAKFPRKWKIVVIVSQIAIIISTFTTKQHYVLDGVAALAITVLAFLFSRYYVDKMIKKEAKENY